MIRPRIDRCFDSFRRNGDPRQLATVFDLTAPELWRIAAHLCRDRHDAEDAVQNTFLAAIECKDEWDGERSVLPWLIGLLVNRVREQRRARARVVDASRLGAQQVVDPASAAGDRELGAAFVAALGAISEPFRSVVEQHFVHGRTAAEIAVATGVPVATVRTRLHRGLEQLRQKLPAGAALGTLVPLRMPAESQAAMRDAVLAKMPGGTAVASSAAVSLLGAIAAHKLWLGLVAAGLGLALWWTMGPASGRAAAGGDSGAVPANVATSEPRHAVASGNNELTATSATEPGMSERLAVTSGDPAATVALLVRNAATQAPLANVQVRVMRDEPPRTRHAATNSDVVSSTTSTAATDAMPESADGHTDAEGRAVLRVAAGRVRIWVGSGLPAIQTVDVPPAITTEHVVDVAPVFTAEVQVIDLHGTPVAEAGIFAKDERGLPVMRELGRTDRNGRWRDPRTETQLLVQAVQAGRAASPATILTDKAGPVVLTLGGEAATIHGRVLDTAGAPVPAAVVVFVSNDSLGKSQWPHTARSDEHGNYRCDWLAPGHYQMLVRDQRDSKSPRVLMAATMALANDTPATDLQFVEGTTLVVRLQRHDGQPVQNHSVQLVRKAAEIPVAFAPWCYFGGKTGADGTCAFDGLSPGRYLLTASFYFATVRKEIEVRTGQPAVFEHRFGELDSLQIVVVDEHDRPRPGILVQRKSSDSEAATHTTDAKGRVWFDPLERGEYEITLSMTEGALSLATHRVSTGTPARLVLPTAGPSGRVHGRLVMTKGALPEGLTLTLHRVSGANPFHSEPVFGTPDATTGTFHYDHLPPVDTTCARW